MRRGLFCAALVGVSSAVCAGGGHESPWKVLPIYGGGYVQNLLVCPTATNVFYTYVDVGGPYRSDDGCRTWRPVHANMPVEMRRRGMDQVRTMSVDPRDANNIVIAAGGPAIRAGGLAVSRDGGETWKITQTACFYGNGHRRMHGFVLDRNPFAPDELVAGEDWSGIFISRDNGETWKKTGPERCWFTDIRYDLNVPGRIYATAPTVDPKRIDNWQFTPEQRKTVRRAGFWRSDDNGETWRRIGDAAADELRQLKGSATLLGVFGGKVVRKSDDGGETWTDYHEGLPVASKMAADAAAWAATFNVLSTVGGDWLTGNRSGDIFRRSPGASTWTKLPRGTWEAGNPDCEPRLQGKDRSRVSMPALNTIVVDPRDDRHWFATDWFALWESGDAGASWTSRVNGMMQLVSFTMAFDPFNSANLIYGVADMRMFVSNDGAYRFRQPDYRPLAGCNSAAFSTRTKGLALTAGGKEFSEILRTRDAGRTWSRAAMRGMPPIKGGHAGGFGVYTVAYDERRDAFWACVSGQVAPGAGGPYVSFDDGESWEWRGEGLPTDIPYYRNVEYADKLTPALAFTHDGHGVTASPRDARFFHLAPDGKRWENHAGDRFKCPLFQIDLVADPFVPSRFLCGGDEVQESTDGGWTWHPYAPLAGKACCRISFDAHNRGRVVFGCPEAIYMSDDGGRTLYALEHGLEYPSGGTRQIYLDRNRLFAMTTGSGVFMRLLDLPPLVCKSVNTVPNEAPSLLPTNRRFKLIWNDEFNGTALDLAKWRYRTHYWGRRAPWFAGPEDGAVIVTNGLLRMPLLKKPDGQFVSASLQTGCRLWDEPFNVWARPGGWPWMKREPPKFQHKFGYYECRCRLQQKAGWWSAFWMQSEGQGATLDPRENGIEHDIMESFEPGELRVHPFFYGGYQWQEIRRFQTPRKTPGLRGTADRAATKVVDKTVFHTFGLLWEPDGYTVFIDGVQDGEKVGCGPKEAVSQVEEFLLVTTEAKEYKWKGDPDPRLEQAVGDEFLVDYVRVYDFVSK